MEAGIDLPRFAVVTPFPNTPLYKRLDAEGRILTKDWELYDAQHVVFQPKHMSVEELQTGIETAWKHAYSFRSIFRRIRRGDKVGEPLSPAAVRDIVKTRAALAGLEDDFSAHSLRSGFVTEATRQGVPIGETMAMTGHASVATVVGYFRSASVIGSKAARLLGDDE